MPTISRFHGITITMYFDDHLPLHFHARSNGRDAKIRIDRVEVLENKLDRRRLAMAVRWAKLHREELEENWRRARNDETLISIEPLR